MSEVMLHQSIRLLCGEAGDSGCLRPGRAGVRTGVVADLYPFQLLHNHAAPWLCLELVDIDVNRLVELKGTCRSRLRPWRVRARRRGGRTGLVGTLRHHNAIALQARVWRL